MWWFYTVILGMSFAQVLSELAIAVRQWATHPDRRPFLPAMTWQVFLLALVVEVWLAVTYYRQTVTTVSIGELLAFLVVPAGILIMSFLLPAAQEPGGDSRAVTADAAFDRVRPVFFGVLIGLVAVNLLHGFLIGQQGWDADLLFQCLIIAGALIGLRVHTNRCDLVLSAVMVIIVACYIGVGYSTVVVDGGGGG